MTKLDLMNRLQVMMDDVAEIQNAIVDDDAVYPFYDDLAVVWYKLDDLVGRIAERAEAEKLGV